MSSRILILRHHYRREKLLAGPQFRFPSDHGLGLLVADVGEGHHEFGFHVAVDFARHVGEVGGVVL